MNKVVLTGRLVSKPQLKQAKTGSFVADFSLAVDRYGQGGEKHTDFILCNTWGKIADNLCKYKDKGDMIGVIGTIRTEKYIAKDGIKRTKVFVAASEVEYLSSTKTSVEGPQEDNLPFE